VGGIELAPEHVPKRQKYRERFAESKEEKDWGSPLLLIVVGLCASAVRQHRPQGEVILCCIAAARNVPVCQLCHQCVGDLNPSFANHKLIIR